MYTGPGLQEFASVADSRGQVSCCILQQEGAVQMECDAILSSTHLQHSPV